MCDPRVLGTRCVGVGRGAQWGRVVAGECERRRRAKWPRRLCASTVPDSPGSSGNAPSGPRRPNGSEHFVSRLHHPCRQYYSCSSSRPAASPPAQHPLSPSRTPTASAATASHDPRQWDPFPVHWVWSPTSLSCSHSPTRRLLVRESHRTLTHRRTRLISAVASPCYDLSPLPSSARFPAMIQKVNPQTNPPTGPEVWGSWGPPSPWGRK